MTLVYLRKPAAIEFSLPLLCGWFATELLSVVFHKPAAGFALFSELWGAFPALPALSSIGLS
jgi:hypothetical protein